MKQWLRRWLGITQLEGDMLKWRAETTAIMFDEFDPWRKGASNELSEYHRKRLIAEDKARKHTVGES